MPFRINGNLDIKFQGLDLNCGLYCLEAVMRWKHGTPYGVGDGGQKRIAHTAAVQNHVNAGNIAFDPGDHLNDYGLVKLKKPPNINEWEVLLRKHGPLIVGGHIGAVRIIPLKDAGHFVVVVGVGVYGGGLAERLKIEYYDPLRLWQAKGLIGPVAMSERKFDQLAYKDVYACQ
jgi:hypothetical protein